MFGLRIDTDRDDKAGAFNDLTATQKANLENKIPGLLLAEWCNLVIYTHNTPVTNQFSIPAFQHSSINSILQFKLKSYRYYVTASLPLFLSAYCDARSYVYMLCVSVLFVCLHKRFSVELYIMISVGWWGGFCLLFFLLPQGIRQQKGRCRR